MGIGVHTILKSKNREIYDVILFSNITSFDTKEIVTKAVNEAKSLDEVKQFLLNYSKYSNIADRIEKFHIDNEPFGDYEEILIVKETANEIRLDSIDIMDYITIANIDSNKVQI